MTRSRHAGLALAGVLALAATMGNALYNGFVYDDVPVIPHNRLVTHATSVLTTLRSTYWNGTLWRPLTLAIFAVQWRVAAGAPWFFHLVALIAYAGVAALLYALLRALRIPQLVAAGTALLFVVHPVHVEVVANAVGQSELWVTSALLGSILWYLRIRRRPYGPTDVGVLVLLCLAAMTAKEEGFIAPALLAMAELLPNDGAQRSGWRRWRLVALSVAIATIMLFVRSSVTGSFAGEIPASAWDGAGIHTRTIAFFGILPRDLLLLVWPLHLQAVYTPPQIPVRGDITWWTCAGVLMAIGAVWAAWHWRRRSPAVTFGIVWCGCALAPVSNIVAPTGLVMAERVLFLPSIGVAIALAGAWTVWRAPLVWHRVALAGVGVWGLMLAVRSRERVPVWHDQRTFFITMTHDAPRSYGAWKTAAAHWSASGDTTRALAALQTSLHLWTRDPQVYEDLGHLLEGQHRCTDAIPTLTDGVARFPEQLRLRTMLVECLIASRRWMAARQMARGGIALGAPQFQSELTRIAAAEAADAGNTSRP